MKHILIDANNMLFRAHFSTKLTNDKGQASSGTFGFMKMMSALLRDFKPDSVIVAWDSKSQKRLDIYPEYKSARKKNRDPKIGEELGRQRKHLKALLRLLPVKQISIEGIEADDTIGYLSTTLKGEVIIISSDEDFLQAINKNVKVFLPSKNLILTHENIDNFIGFPVEHYVFWKAMVGDTSDSIKGVGGIGPVKGTARIREGVTSIDKLPAHEREIAARNIKLMGFGELLDKKEIGEIRSSYISERDKTPNVQMVGRIFTRMGFMSLSKHFDEWSEPFNKLISTSK